MRPCDVPGTDLLLQIGKGHVVNQLTNDYPPLRVVCLNCVRPVLIAKSSAYLCLQDVIQGNFGDLCW